MKAICQHLNWVLKFPAAFTTLIYTGAHINDSTHCAFHSRHNRSCRNKIYLRLCHTHTLTYAYTINMYVYKVTQTVLQENIRKAIKQNCKIVIAALATIVKLCKFILRAFSFALQAAGVNAVAVEDVSRMFGKWFALDLQLYGMAQATEARCYLYVYTSFI